MTRRAAHAPFVVALAGAQLQLALDDPPPAGAGDAARFAANRLRAAPALMRIGLCALLAVLQAQVLLVERTTFAALSARSQARWVARWSASPLPGVTAVLDATAGLALTRFYEQRAFA